MASKLQDLYREKARLHLIPHSLISINPTQEEILRLLELDSHYNITKQTPSLDISDLYVKALSNDGICSTTYLRERFEFVAWLKNTQPKPTAADKPIEEIIPSYLDRIVTQTKKSSNFYWSPRALWRAAINR